MAGVLAGCALLLLILVLLPLLRLRQPSGFVAFKDTNGKVEISRSAIESLVEATCAQVDSIDHPRVKTNLVKGALHLRIFLHVKGDVQVREIREQLSNHIQAQLIDNLGFSKLHGVDIVVQRIGAVPLSKKSQIAPVKLSDKPGGEPVK